MHHLIDVSHEHEFKPYSLSDEYGIYYTGYKCECGVAGYEVPVKEPSGIPVIEKIDLVEPTPEEWIAHLDEEHEDDEQSH